MYMSGVLNNSLWLLYVILQGFKESGMPKLLAPFLCNAVGLTVNLIYSSVFVCNSKLNGPRNLLLGAVSIAIIYVSLAASGVARDSDVASLAVVINVITLGAPLSVIGTVLREESVAAMPLLISLGATLCPMSWMTYAMYVRDTTHKGALTAPFSSRARLLPPTAPTPV